MTVQLTDKEQSTQGHWYLWSFDADDGTTVTEPEGVPRRGTIRRVKWVGDSNTSLPRFLAGDADGSEAAGASVLELAATPGAAAQSADRVTDLPYRSPDGKLRAQLQGSGSKTVALEVLIFPSWRS